MKLWNFRGEQKSISEALQVVVPERAVISFTGSGGKTSLMFAWARELSASGKRVVVTTTTRLLHPGKVDPRFENPYGDVHVVYIEPDIEEIDLLSEIDRTLDTEKLVMVVATDPDHPTKVSGPPQPIMDHLYKIADLVMIEADGSKRRPLKWPAPWEPVVPENTDITVCIAGMSSLGQPLNDVLFREELLPDAYRRDVIDEKLISALAASLDGGQKGARGEFRVFLNQADTVELQNAAARIQMMLAVQGIQSAWGKLK